MTKNKGSWQSKMGVSPENVKVSDENVDNNPDIAENIDENQENDTNSGQNGDNELVILQEKLKNAEQKASDSNNRLLRALAEIENMRRRSKEELEKTSVFAISGFVTDLVVVTENFFLACDNLPKTDENSSNELKNLVLAVEMTKKEMTKVLEKNKVKRIFPLNQKFDHAIHEAVSYVESENEEGEVINVVQAGYVLGERIIRPSLVVVSKGRP